MKVYLIEEERTARQLGLMLRLNAECAKLRWSKIVDNVPENVYEALGTIEAYVEETLAGHCNASNEFASLSDAEENGIMALIKSSPILRNTLGTGIVLAGPQAEEVKALIAGNTETAKIASAIATGKNVAVI